MMRAASLLLVSAGSLVAGCERDPTFFGYWDIVAAEHGGIAQEDMGFLEVLDDGSVALFLRYRWTTDGFAPDAHPAVIFGDTDATRQEFLGNYAEKDEVHRILLTPFGPQTVFTVGTYYGDEAVITAPDAVWPEASEPLLTMLELRR